MSDPRPTLTLGNVAFGQAIANAEAWKAKNAYRGPSVEYCGPPVVTHIHNLWEPPEPLEIDAVNRFLIQRCGVCHFIEIKARLENLPHA